MEFTMEKCVIHIINERKQKKYLKEGNYSMC